MAQGVDTTQRSSLMRWERNGDLKLSSPIALPDSRTDTRNTTALKAPKKKGLARLKSKISHFNLRKSKSLKPSSQIIPAAEPMSTHEERNTYQSSLPGSNPQVPDGFVIPKDGIVLIPNNSAQPSDSKIVSANNLIGVDNVNRPENKPSKSKYFPRQRRGSSVTPAQQVRTRPLSYNSYTSSSSSSTSLTLSPTPNTSQSDVEGVIEINKANTNPSSKVVDEPTQTLNLKEPDITQKLAKDRTVNGGNTEIATGIQQSGTRAVISPNQGAPQIKGAAKDEGDEAVARLLATLADGENTNQELFLSVEPVQLDNKLINLGGRGAEKGKSPATQSVPQDATQRTTPLKSPAPKRRFVFPGYGRFRISQHMTSVNAGPSRTPVDSVVRPPLERTLPGLLRKVEEEDRLLAEQLQRFEDEDYILGLDKAALAEIERLKLEDELKEKQRKEELARIAKEDELIAQAMIQAELEEERRQRARRDKEEKERKEREKQEILARQQSVGAPIVIRQLNAFGRFNDVGLDKLTTDAARDLKEVKEAFSRGFPGFKIIKIEWIINDKLRQRYEEAKRQLEAVGRCTDEKILFHGTPGSNITSIIKDGLKIGGVEGHRIAHGSSMGIGVYSCTEAVMPVNSYNKGSKVAVAFRALPGPIGVDLFDSHFAGAIYVIRRSCQCLPCFLRVHGIEMSLANIIVSYDNFIEKFLIFIALAEICSEYPRDLIVHIHHVLELNTRTPRAKHSPKSARQFLGRDPVVRMGLNNAQKEAVHTSPGSILQILAGPGSGKTKVLTHRVCFLLEQGLRPENIILTTFTNKAAREMKERIGKLGGNGVEAKLITGTFHSICRRYLVKYGSLISLPKGFGIADSDDSKSILKTILKDLRSSLEPDHVRNVISHQKSNDISAEQFFANLNSNCKFRQRGETSIISFEMAQIYRMYEDKLQSMNLLDFDDLLLRTCTLLRLHPHVISNIQHVLIDEFQDTNIVQYTLMRLFAQHCNAISIVGDPDQGIYGWRSANAGNLKQMRQDYKDVLVVNLEENYRSSTWILKVSLAVIEQDSARFAKTLLGTKMWGMQPVLRTLADVHLEARWIAREIKRVIGLTGGLITEKDVAILVRTASLTRPIESGLASAGLRYRMVGGRKFFDREEIKDLLAYLRVIHSLKDTAALLRILNVPNRRLGKERISVLIKDTESKNRSLWESIQALITGEIRFATNDKAAEIGLGNFVRCINSSRQKLAKRELATVSDLIDYVRKNVQYDDYLRKKFGPEADERIGNLEELKTFSKEVEQVVEENKLPDIGVLEAVDVEEDALSRFLGNIALMTDVRDNGEDKVDCITISTIHAAKGLEWPVVFVPGLYQGSIPHLKSEDTDEERRLLYVAMTRAQGLLYLSFPTRNSNNDNNKMSIFLEDPRMGKLLATRGGAIDIDGIATILNRPLPTKEEISKSSANLSSVDDEDWIERDPSDHGPLLNGFNAAQRIRDWQPQSAIVGTSTTPIGFKTTQISHTFGAGAMSRNTTLNTMTQIGFVTTREALSILPPEQLTNNFNPRKRRADPLPTSRKAKASQPNQTSLASWISGDSQPQQISEPKRFRSSGIIQDRMKVSCRPKTPTLIPDCLPSSSPERGYDPDSLPAVSFSSPYKDTCKDKAAVAQECVNEIPTSPLVPQIEASVVAHTFAKQIPGANSAGKKYLGIRRGMKPWSARN